MARKLPKRDRVGRGWAIYMPDDFRRSVERVADSKRVSVSALIRAALIVQFPELGEVQPEEVQP